MGVAKLKQELRTMMALKVNSAEDAAFKKQEVECIQAQIDKIQNTEKSLEKTRMNKLYKIKQKYEEICSLLPRDMDKQKKK